MALLGTEILKGFWQVRIYDTAGKLVDLPQADIESIDFEDVLNGGSGTCTLTFKRNYNQIGAVAWGYSVLIWIWAPGTTPPTDPYYSGHIVDFDQEQLATSGRVVAKIEGDAKLLDAAIVTEQVNPGISGNPNLDAATYIAHLLTTYQPANFSAATIPSPMFNMFPTSFDGAKLGAAVDTVTKQGRDLSGALWTWFVRTKADLTRRVVVQPDQNPNQIVGPKFTHLFVGSMLDQYKIQNVYRDIINVVAVYGAKDPQTGQQAYGVFADPVSSQPPPTGYGPLEDKISVPALLTNAACQAYATVWLTLHAFPQAQGTARLLQCDPGILAGTWAQIWEVPATGIAGAIIKQVRIARVHVVIQGERIEQTISTTSPVPYLDEAVYRMGLNVTASQAIQNTPISVNKQTLYIRSGGFVTATGSGGGNGKVAIAATAASFPAAQVSAAALALTSLIDNSGGPNNGVGGDGNFTVSLSSAGAYVITKGPRPANSPTQQNLCGAVVSSGAIIAGGVTDLRNLIAMPALPPGTTPAIASGSAVLTYPNGTGGPTFDAQVVVNLGTAASNAVREIYQLELWVAAHGASNATPQLWAHLDPNASGSYTFLFQQLAAGTQWDLYVAERDNSGLIGGSLGAVPPTNMLLLATTATNPIMISGGVLAPVPVGFVFTAAQSSVLYGAVNSGAGQLNFVCTLTISNFGTGTPALSTWVDHLAIDAQDDTGAWSEVGQVPYAASISSGTIWGVAVALGAGRAWPIRVRLVAINPASQIATATIFTTTAQQIGNTSMKTMPSGILSGGPTVSSATLSGRTNRAGMVRSGTVTFTETDFTSTLPTWIDKIIGRIRVNGDSAGARQIGIDPRSSTSGTYTQPVLLTAGDVVDFGLSYTDQAGQESAINWCVTNNSDAGGAFFDSGNAYATADHAKLSLGVQGAVDSTSNILSTDFANAKQKLDGSLANVEGNFANKSVPWRTGSFIHVTGRISKGSVGSSAGFFIGTNVYLNTGYYLHHDGATTLVVYRVNAGVQTGIASVTTSADDANPHTYSLTIRQLTAGVYTIEASYDNYVIAPFTDNGITLGGGGPLWVAPLTGGSGGTLANFECDGGEQHYITAPGQMRNVIDQNSRTLTTDFDGAYEDSPVGAYPGYLVFPSSSAWRLEKTRKQYDLTKAPLFIESLGRIAINVNNQHGVTFCNDTTGGGNAANDYEVVLVGATLNIITRKASSQTTLASMAVSYAPDASIDQMLRVLASYDGTTVTIIAQWGKDAPLVATDSSSPLTAGFGGVRCVGDTVTLRYAIFSQEAGAVQTFAFGSQYLDLIGSITKTTPIFNKIPNALPNVLSDVSIQYSSTTTSVSVWVMNQAATGNPVWVPPDGSAQVSPTNGGSSGSPLATFGSLSASTDYWPVIMYNKLTNAWTANLYANPSDAQLAAALADGGLFVVAASAATASKIRTPGSGTGGGGFNGGGGRPRA